MKVFVSALCCLLLSGCVAKATSARVSLDLPSPEPLNLRPVTWRVLPQAKDGKSSPFIALTEDDYKNLSLNVRDITNFMKMQQLIIQKYKEYYDKH